MAAAVGAGGGVRKDQGRPRRADDVRSGPTPRTILTNAMTTEALPFAFENLFAVAASPSAGISPEAEFLRIDRSRRRPSLPADQ